MTISRFLALRLCEQQPIPQNWELLTAIEYNRTLRDCDHGAHYDRQEIPNEKWDLNSPRYIRVSLRPT